MIAALAVAAIFMPPAALPGRSVAREEAGRVFGSLCATQDHGSEPHCSEACGSKSAQAWSNAASGNKTVLDNCLPESVCKDDFWSASACSGS
jgi:hypothetical protein